MRRTAFKSAKPCACAHEHAPCTAPGSEWLGDALAVGNVVVFEWDRRTRVSRRSANAAEILGFAPDNGQEAERFLARIHPHDRAQFIAKLRRLRPDQPHFSLTFRFVRPDGRQIWLEETARGEFDGDGRILSLRGSSRDVSTSKRVEEHQRLLIAELDHRLKNVVARVSAVAKATSQGSSSVSEYVDLLDRRLQSLADAHALLQRHRFQGIDIADLVRWQLAPYAVCGNTTVSGPKVILPPEAAEALALVLHELVTNAAKYGALQVQDGRVLVTWELRSPAACRLSWREFGGHGSPGSNRVGYGLTLIRELVGYELGGAVNFEFGDDGAHCAIDMPLKQAGRLQNH